MFRHKKYVQKLYYSCSRFMKTVAKWMDKENINDNVIK